MENFVHMLDLPNNYLNEYDPWAGIITTSDVDIQNLYHTTLLSIPIQLVLVCNMILSTPFIDDWNAIMWSEQELIAQNNKNLIKTTNHRALEYMKKYKCDKKIDR